MRPVIRVGGAFGIEQNEIASSAVFLQKRRGVRTYCRNARGQCGCRQMRHRSVIFWTMGKDKTGDGLWYCYLDEPHVLDEGLFPEACKPQ